MAELDRVLAARMDELLARAEHSEKWQTAVGIVGVAAPILLLILSLIFLVGNTYNPFLYFQF